jgi:hypothetical protein
MSPQAGTIHLNHRSTQMKTDLARLSWSRGATLQLAHHSGPTRSGFESVFICVHLWLIHFPTELFRPGGLPGREQIEDFSASHV